MKKYTEIYTLLLMIIIILTYAIFNNRRVIDNVKLEETEPEVMILTVNEPESENTIVEPKSENITVEPEIQEVSVPIEEPQQEVEVYQEPEPDLPTYKITHYGPDCSGCSGRTASGYNVSNTIYYNDYEYGQVRIIAVKDLPLYTIVKIHDYKIGEDTLAIVLDRGVGYGVIDLLVESESQASQFGIQRGVQIEILRSGG